MQESGSRVLSTLYQNQANRESPGPHCGQSHARVGLQKPERDHLICRQPTTRFPLKTTRLDVDTVIHKIVAISSCSN